MPRLRSFVALLVLATTCVVTNAKAEVAEASDHHRAGVAYAKSGKWEQAVREFDEAYKLDPTPLRLYDVAQVCLQAKQYVRAREAYAKVADSPSLSADQQQRARAGLATAKANIARVRIVVSAPKQSDVVTVDGVKARSDVVDVDPGHHVVKLVRDGEANEVTVDVSPGGEATATLGESKKETPPPPGPSSREAESGGVPVTTWVFGGIALAGLGVGIPLAVTGYLDYEDIKENDPCAQTSTCGGIDEEPRRRAIVGDILAGVGVLSAAAAIYFYVTADGPTATKAPGSARFRTVDFRAASGGGLIGIRGSF